MTTVTTPGIPSTLTIGRKRVTIELKQFFREKGSVRLQPANDAYPPMFYEDVRIQGKLIGVIRRLD